MFGRGEQKWIHVSVRALFCENMQILSFNRSCFFPAPFCGWNLGRRGWNVGSKVLMQRRRALTHNSCKTRMHKDPNLITKLLDQVPGYITP